MRAHLAIATLSLSGCFAVDAVSSPYGEDKPRGDVSPATPELTQPAKPRCKPDGAFTRQEEFYARSETSVFGVRLLPDESVAYGTVVVDGIWGLARIQPGHPPALDDFKVGTSVGYPSITGDGAVVFFARYDGEVNAQRRGDVYVSRRPNKAGIFEKASTVPIVTENEESTPYVTPQADALYFTRLEGDRYLLLRIALPAVELSETGVFIAGAAPAGDNINPVVTPDELTLFFAARNERGDFDVWTAKQPKRGARFRDPHPIAELRTENAEMPSWISPDGCVLYFDRWENQTHSKVMRAFRE